MGSGATKNHGTFQPWAASNSQPLNVVKQHHDIAYPVHDLELDPPMAEACLHATRDTR